MKYLSIIFALSTLFITGCSPLQVQLGYWDMEAADEEKVRRLGWAFGGADIVFISAKSESDAELIRRNLRYEFCCGQAYNFDINHNDGKWQYIVYDSSVKHIEEIDIETKLIKITSYGQIINLVVTGSLGKENKTRIENTLIKLYQENPLLIVVGDHSPELLNNDLIQMKDKPGFIVSRELEDIVSQPANPDKYNKEMKILGNASILHLQFQEDNI